MAALHCTVASVPAFHLTDANARAGKRGEGGGEADSKVLGACGPDKLNKNGKLLLGFAGDTKLALLNTLFCTPKSGVSYALQSANRSKGQARLDYILAKQADRRLIRCVNVRRPPLALPPIPEGTCISDISTDMADVILSTAAELIPRSKRPRRVQGWCAGPGVEAEINEAWQEREEARRHPRAEPHNSNLRKTVKIAGKTWEGAQGCRAELVLGLRPQT